MRLEINDLNFKDYILSINLNKSSDLLICIPSYNSYAITSKTIESFLFQKKIKFDILVIGPSGDIEKLAENFPQINYCITKDNYGSSGNQLLNIFISKHNLYKYFILTDNDARLIEENTLNTILNILISRKLVCVLNSTAVAFHCGLYSREIFDKINYFFNPNYFLWFDDTSFMKKIQFYYPNRYELVEFDYFHPKKLEGTCFSYKYAYIFTRSILIYLFREPFPFRVKLSAWYLRPCLFFLIYFSFKYRLDFLKMFFNSLQQVLKDDYNFSYLEKINPKFSYKEISEFEAKENYSNIYFKLISHPKDTFFNPKAFKYIESDKSTKYFIRVS